MKVCVEPTELTDTMREEKAVEMEGPRVPSYDKHIIQQSKLYQAMRPLIWSLKLSGLYHEHEWRINDETGNLEETGKVTPCRIWCIVSIFIHWLNIGKILLVFLRDNEFGPGLLLKIMLVMWHLCVGISCVIMYRAWAKPENLPGFIYKWETLHKPNLDETLKKLKRQIKIGLFFTWGGCAVNFFYFYYITFSYDIVNGCMVPFEKGNTLFVAKLVFVAVSGTLVNVTFTMTILFHIVVMWLLINEFKIYNKHFKVSINRSRGLEGNIETYRTRHMDICQLTGFADETFKHYHVVAIGIPIVVTLITIYNIMYSDEIKNNLFLMMVMISFILQNLYFMIEVLVMCVLVNDTAHDSYDDVHSLDLQKMGQKEVLQVSILLNKLSGHPDPIGLKVASLFVINGETILTVFGLLLSYFFLLLSFKPTSSESVTSTSCN